MKPVFILSLPRSGSTLLQRLLAAHSEVSSVAEPWILLPVAGIAGEGGFQQYSDYSSRLATKAVRELIQELPGRMDQYHAAVRAFCEQLYHGMCQPSDRYFVDKTPRYYLLTDFIFDVFPEAKILFLFRNPLDVLSSAVTTFSKGRFAVHHAHVDLIEGPVRLHEAHVRHAQKGFSLSYEDLVSDPELVTRELCDFLDLPYEENMLAGYREVSFRGSMGDPTGDVKYGGVDARSVGRWKTVLTSPTRRWFARKYIRALGEDVLRTFGVSLGELERELAEMPFAPSGALRDVFWLAASSVSRHASLNLWRSQMRLPPPRRHKLD